MFWWQLHEKIALLIKHNISQICTDMLHCIYTRMLIHVHTAMYALHISFVKLP